MTNDIDKILIEKHLRNGRIMLVDRKLDLFIHCDRIEENDVSYNIFKGVDYIACLYKYQYKIIEEVI